MLLGMRLDMIQTHTLRITPTFLSIIAEIDKKLADLVQQVAQR